ncbi:MAG: adenylate/guanylate cyclase domain-containing protein [Treponema sp.]|jgi:class 3 adenylate cyclase|nr:adenylate/guanylate cyclase domain-containing protein [Treponema sp.]
MGKNNKLAAAVIVCFFVFILCAAVNLLNPDLLKRPFFQKKTEFINAAAAKYGKDGSLYIIDNGAFRLIGMSPEGRINYSININKMKEYLKIYDSAVDEAGNLYIYATELAYDAYMTKRDIIRKYDRQGNFVKEVFAVSYEENSENPRTNPQIGSLRCENGILTFSRVRRKGVDLYAYDTFREELAVSDFSHGTSDFSVAQLAVKDFKNFIYTTRDGDIYEVQNGEAPVLRGSFDFIMGGGGIIPWYLDYDSRGDILFADMISAAIFRITRDNRVEKVLPEGLFDELRARDLPLFLTGFGFFENRFAGVYGDVVWYYDGKDFRTYEEGVGLSVRERSAVIAVQASCVLGGLAFILGIYLLFVRLLDRYVSLFIKQTVVIIPLTIAAFIVLYSVTFHIMTERLNQEIFNELNFISTLAVQSIDGDDIDSLKSIKDVNGDAYKRVAQTVKQITGNNDEVWNNNYYVAIYKGEHFEYWVVLSNDEMSLFRPAGYFSMGDEDYEIVMSGKPVAGVVNATDGLWGYSVIPVYNSQGKIAGMFELGLDMTSHQVRNLRQRQEISLIAALICLVILLALIVVMSIVVRQLASVAGVLGAIAGGDYSARVSYRARDELGRVSRGLNYMAGELQQQFEYINRLNESSIRFVPIQFMEHLGVTDITKLKLGDYVQRDLTVLFFDIRAFSINSEMMSAQENFLFINEVLGVTGPVFRKHNGFVDKYLGDAAMVLFAEARDAVRAGIEIYRKLILDKAARIKIGVDGINIGVGLHTGSVMMGIVGENERLSSTVISKNVNLASRMESLTKQTKSGMLITRDTLNQLSGGEEEFKYRFIGMIQVAGVNEVIGVFDMLDALPAQIKKRRLATKKVFESGIRKYHMKEYQNALKRFERVLAADPGDICAANCLAETKKRLADPGLPSVFIFDKK